MFFTIKSLKLLLITTFIAFSNSVNAQTSVSVNLGSPPLWGPAGYPEARYYYLPDILCYYDVQNSTFIHYGNGLWHRKASLPGRYRNYDLYDGYKVVMIGYHGETPYEKFQEYKHKYKIGYREDAQKTIGERPEESNSRYKSENKGEDKKKGHDEDDQKQ